jgi:hypothetical protein
MKTIRYVGFQFASRISSGKRKIKEEHGAHSRAAMFQEYELSGNGRAS